MKLSSILCASFVGVAAFAFAASGASINYNASKSNTGNMTAQPTTTCPTGQTWDATTKKCIAASAINVNSSRSNTQHNVMSTDHPITDGAAKGQANEGTVGAPATGTGNKANMAVKGSGVPTNGSTTAPATTTTPSPTH